MRQRLVEQGFSAALNRKEQQNRRQRLLDGEKEAHLIALTCSSPPEGQGRWTMKMLGSRMVQLGHVESSNSHLGQNRTLVLYKMQRTNIN